VVAEVRQRQARDGRRARSVLASDDSSETSPDVRSSTSFRPLQAALFGSLLVVAISAAGGVVARLRAGVIRWPVALVFAAASVPAAFAGTAISRLLPGQWLLLAFAALMAVVALRMLRGDPDSGGGACRTATGAVNWRSCLPKTLGAGVAVGILTGLFGVGGGFVIVPALTLLLGLTAA